MALEDIFKGGNILTGLAIGAGVALATRLAPGVAGGTGGALRPVVRTVLKVPLLAWDAARQTVAAAAEAASDLYAEAEYEVHAGKAAQRQPLSDAITDL